MRKRSRRPKRFISKLHEQLFADIETERWKLIVEQRTIVAEYQRVTKELHASDEKIARFSGPMPDANQCPGCYYRSGNAVDLIPAKGEDDRGGGTKQCPACGMLVPLG